MRISKIFGESNELIRVTSVEQKDMINWGGGGSRVLTTGRIDR